MRFQPTIEPCIAIGGSASFHAGKLERMREIVMAELGDLVRGESAQADMGWGRDGLFKQDAEAVLADEPHWPETGFREIARKALTRAKNPVSVIVDYEPNQTAGDPKRATRFDLGNRSRTTAEIDLIGRCVAVVRTEAYALGLMPDVGVWNTPGVIRQHTQYAPAWKSLRPFYGICNLDYSFSNIYPPKPHDTWREQRQEIKADCKTLAREIGLPVRIAMMPNKTPGRFDPFTAGEIITKAKGAKGARCTVVWWLNTDWIMDESNENHIANACRALKRGLR